MFYIYKTTCVVNGKSYIGQHCRDPIKRGYFGSGKILKHALKKYGSQNFSQEILEICKSREESDNAEIKWIMFYNAVESDMFYNLASGGIGYVPAQSIESRMKRVATIKEKIVKQGFWNSDQTREKLKETNRIERENKTMKKMKTGSLISPDGVLHTFIGYQEFAKEHGLNTGALSQVLLGKKSHHKGWTTPKLPTSVAP